MSMMTFQITPDEGEPFRVVAGSRDVLAWEKAGKGRSFGQLSPETLHMMDLYGLSYFAARRQGLFVGTQQEWESSVDLMPIGDDKEDEGEGVDPTQSTPTDGNSSPSPSPPASPRRSGQRKAPQP